MKLAQVIIILLTTYGLSAQTLSEANKFLGRSEYKKAIALFKTIKKEAQENKFSDTIILANNGIANAYLDLGAYYKSISLLQENLNLLSLQETKNYSLLAENHHLLANNYRSLNLLEDFKTESEAFYKYYKKVYPNKAIYKALYYAYLGRYYKMKFISDKAEYYIKTALDISRKNKKDHDLIDVFEIYRSYSFLIRDTTNNDTDSALQNQYKYGDSLIYYFHQKYPYANVKKTAMILGKTAVNLDQAARLLTLENGNSNKANKTHAFTAIKDYNLAIALLDEKTSYYNPETTRFLALKGLIYFYLKDYDNALNSYNEGIKRLTSLQTINNSISLDNYRLLTLLKWKSWCLDVMYNESPSSNLLFKNETTLLLMEQVWDRYSAELIHTKAQYQSDTYNMVPYTFIMKNYIDLYELTKDDIYLEKVVEYDEKSKYSSLLKSINSNKSPEGYNATLNDKRLIMYDALSNSLLNQSNIVTEIEQTIEASVSNYLNEEQVITEKLGTGIISLEALQQQLKPNEAIVSFTSLNFQTGSTPFIKLIEKNKIKLIKAKKLDENWRSSISDSINYALATHNIASYKKDAFKIYTNYFQPIEAELSEGITHLKIIPDATFSNLSFESLLYEETTTNDYRKLPYLINKYDFSYILSSSISKLNNTEKLEASYQMAFFSPTFEGNELSKLTLSKEDAKVLSNIYDASFFEGNRATLQTFKNAIESTKIVAVFSHGQSNNWYDDETKGIYLTDGFLNLKTIYNLKSQCEFLILGACETGYGEKVRGEGNINLARAFSSIGVRSMLLASWKIDEATTMQITTLFLNYLQEGYSKSEALQKAKLDFIKTTNPRNANPYYWSGLNVVGNNDNVKPHPKSSFYYFGWMLLIFPLTGGFWYFKKKLK